MTIMYKLKFTLLFTLLSAAVFAGEQIRYNTVPDTISPEAQRALTELYANKAYARTFPAADDLDGWRKTHGGAEQAKKSLNEKAVAGNQVTVKDAKLGGVPVLDIRPNGWQISN